MAIDEVHAPKLGVASTHSSLYLGIRSTKRRKIRVWFQLQISLLINLTMKYTIFTFIVILLVQNSSEDEVQSFYVPQFQDNPSSPLFTSLTPDPSKPPPDPISVPVNTVSVNPVPVNPAPVNQVVNQPLDDFLQQLPPTPNAECYIRQCDQIITGRNLLYSRALEIVQNEEYLSEADLDLIRRRYKRQTNTSTSGTTSIFSTEPLQNVDLLPTLIGLGVGIGTLAVGALYAIPDLPLTSPSGVPPSNPQPGTPGGGGEPNTLPQAVALVPPGLNAIAVFPPYITPRTIPAISVIFAENSAIGPQIGRRKRSENWYVREKLGQLMKRFRCLRVKLRYRSLKKKYPPTTYHPHYGKREVINSLDDCFDFIDEPLYGFRTLVSTEKFCLGNDLNCLQTSSSTIGIQSRQAEEFVSEAPADCRLTLTQNQNCV